MSQFLFAHDFWPGMCEGGGGAFNFRSLVPQNAARPALDYLAGWLGESAAEEIARIIQWPVTTSVDANVEGDDG